MQPRVVTAVKNGPATLSRTVIVLYEGILALLPPRPTRGAEFEDYLKWENEHFWLINYHVAPEDVARARELALTIHRLSTVGNREAALGLLAELRKLRLPELYDMEPCRRWDYIMAHMPQDMGGPNKPKIREFLSSVNQGRVLEAMCGFRTYYDESPTREVVGADFSREALERYPSNRQRVQIDFNNLDDSSFELLGKESFDVVSICFGLNYLKDPSRAFSFFREVLRPGGRLTLIENPIQGYWDLAARGTGFDDQSCWRFLREGGFTLATIETLDHIPLDWEKDQGGLYYFVNATKT